MFCARNGVWGKWGKGVEKFPNIVWNILGNQGVACLLHAVFLHFVVESLAVDGKQLGSLALVAVGGSQGSGDAFLFRLFAVQLHIDWSGCGGLCHRLLQFLGTDILATGEQGGALHHIVQFAQVARPVV